MTKRDRLGLRVFAAAMFAIGLQFSLEETAAGQPHRHHSRVRATRSLESGQPVTGRYARLPIPYAYSFYPHEIEGGVSGNLPFNNQIRKFRDPLNANGAGG